MLAERGERRDGALAPGVCAAVRATRSRARSAELMPPPRSGAEADARLVGIDAHVGDLRQIDPQRSVLEREVEPAIGAAERRAKAVEGVRRRPVRPAPGRRRSRSRSSGGVPGSRPGRLDDFAEHAAGRPGWTKATREACSPVRGAAVDQLDLAPGKLGERRVDVGDAVGDVMHAGAAAGEETPNRRVRARAARAARCAPRRAPAAPPRRPAR